MYSWCIVSARRKYDQRGRTPRTTVSSAPTPGSVGLIRNDWPIVEPPCGFSPYASASTSTTVDFPDPFSPTSTVSPAGTSRPSRSTCARAGTLAGHTDLVDPHVRSGEEGPDRAGVELPAVRHAPMMAGGKDIYAERAWCPRPLMQ